MHARLRNSSWRLLLGLLAVGLIGAGGLGGVALWHHMNVPTYLASLRTPQVTVADLEQGKLKPVVLVDVRSPAEYAQDHIAQSVLVPLTDLQQGFGVQQIQAIARSAARGQSQPTIVLYCTAGQRSVQAYQILQTSGLKFVVLTGGFQRWRQAIPATQDRKVLAAVTVAGP